MRRLQPFQKPSLLPRAEDRLRRLALAEVVDLDAAVGNLRRRIAIRVGPPGIENLQSFLREQIREVVARERCGLSASGGFLGSVAVLVGNDEIEMLAPA